MRLLAQVQEFDSGLTPVFLTGKPSPAFVNFPSFSDGPSGSVDPYLFCVGLSFCGLALMVLSGLGHRGHHHHHGARGHGAGKGHSHHHRGGHASRGAWCLLGLFSPRVLFSLLMGFGATGSVLRVTTSLPPFLVAVAAVAGGLAFEHFVVRPFWNVLFGFASKPALTLETTLFSAGEAATDFDRTGHGLVRLELDGQVRQVLASLAPGEHAPGAPRVRTGERLFIRSVDRRRNVCTVSRLGC